MQGKNALHQLWANSRKLVAVGLENLRKEGFALTARKAIRFLLRRRNVNYREWMSVQLSTQEQL